MSFRGNYPNDDLDCEDGDSTINPLATEANDGVDNNCNGQVDEDFDGDGDGYSSATGDCDNTDPDVNPGAQELCGNDGTGDGLDNNCNNEADEGCS